MASSPELADVAKKSDAAPTPGSPGRWVGTLYFAEGLPATVVATVAAVLLKGLQVSNDAIALYTSALTLPWILRPLWSPLLEVFRTKRFFIILTEALVGAGLLGVAISLPLGHLALCLIFFGVVALSAATHDMAADGFFITTLSIEKQTRYVGWLGVAFTTARFATQGLVVVLAGTLEPHIGFVHSWQVAFVLLSAVAALLAIYHWRFLPQDVPAVAVARGATALAARSVDVVKTFFTKADLAPVLLLVLFYRLCEGQLVRIVLLFLLDPNERGGLGLSTAQLGASYGGAGAIAFMLGALGGGSLASKVGLRRAVIWLCAAFNAPALIYWCLALAHPRSLGLVTGAIICEQFLYGFGSIGLKLLMMQRLAVGPYQTAHFAFAVALSGISASLVGMLSGRLEVSLGYAPFFACVFICALPALTAAYYSRRILPLPDSPGGELELNLSA
jgi:PAT family beta-lactamase induction signal transducer AmpG